MKTSPEYDDFTIELCVHLHMEKSEIVKWIAPFTWTQNNSATAGPWQQQLTEKLLNMVISSDRHSRNFMRSRLEPSNRSTRNPGSTEGCARDHVFAAPASSRRNPHRNIFETSWWWGRWWRRVRQYCSLSLHLWSSLGLYSCLFERRWRPPPPWSNESWNCRVLCFSLAEMLTSCLKKSIPNVL